MKEVKPKYPKRAAQVDELIRQGVKRCDIPQYGIAVQYYDWRRRRMESMEGIKLRGEGFSREPALQHTPLNDLMIVRSACRQRVPDMSEMDFSAYLKSYEGQGLMISVALGK